MPSSPIRKLTPLAEAAKAREASINEQKRILSGESDKLMLVIGPCSADREDAVLDYIYRLRGVEEKVKLSYGFVQSFLLWAD